MISENQMKSEQLEGLASRIHAKLKAINARKKCFEVLDGGFETTVQDDHGRQGYLRYGVPRSGPLDRHSFQLGNQLLNNPEDAAGLEIQFVGPQLRFFTETAIAITGADNIPKINQKRVPFWQTIGVQPGDVLSFDHAAMGARTYIAFAGGLDVPIVMGSRSTFIRAGIGGFQGRKLLPGDVLRTFTPASPLHLLLDRTLPTASIPHFSNHWQVDVMVGPYEDCLTEADMEQFLAHEWVVSSKSDRIGYRLEGPPFQFATPVSPQADGESSHPSNKIDYGCPLGSILFCGHTPTILLSDCPSLTGYLSAFTVVDESLRNVGQARPGDIITFKQVSHPRLTGFYPHPQPMLTPDSSQILATARYLYD